MPQQRVDLGFAATEGLEALQGWAAATGLKNLATIALTRAGVQNASLFKGTPSVRRENFCPFIAVVTGAVAPGKDVREGMGAARESGRKDHRDLLAYLVCHCQHALSGFWLGVQAHVEQGVFHLAQGLQAALEVLGRQHLVEERARHGLAAVHMGG